MNTILPHLQELVSWSYLTARFPGNLTRPVFLGWLIVSGAAIVIAMGIRLVLAWRSSTSPVWARWWKKYSTMAATFGFISLILLFLRYERVPVLSVRIFIAGWLVWVGIWKLKLLYAAWKKVPQEVANWKDRQRINKYLPKK